MAASSKQSGQRRAQGGGRTPNSEPRIQVFKEFNGINFENVNRSSGDIDIDVARYDDGDQTDLPMNYLFLQNNVATCSNKTMEVRDDLMTLFRAPDGVRFTGPAQVINSWVYLAKSDGNIAICDLYNRYMGGEVVEATGNMTIVDHNEIGHTWTSFEHYDDKLIALTQQNEIWTADTMSYTIENAIEVPDPTIQGLRSESNPNGWGVQGYNGLTISETADTTHTHRINIALSYVNKYGPTRLSPITTFYVNIPMTEWGVLGTYPFASLSFDIIGGYGVMAAELYYSVNESTTMLLFDRYENTAVSDVDYTAHYDWYGYTDATDMWTVANLVAPTENYTMGVHASRLTVIDGRFYFWGDHDQPQRLYIGGNPGNLLSISPGTGGGFVDVEPGTNESVRYVCKYKTQAGNSIVTMLCDSPNSHREKRFNLVENSVALSNEQSMKSWQAEQVAGAVGCKSYHGALVCQDGLYSVSRYGLALTTLTMEYNSQIRTTYVSDAIKPVFIDAVDKGRRLSNAMLLECDNVIYMALGTGSDQRGNLDNVLFCYDIGLKAWWTHTIDVDEPILGMFHIDWQDGREGIGIVTGRHVYLLPTTNTDDKSSNVRHRFLIETAQLSTQMPQQGWQYLSQLEFHFDYFVGNASIAIKMTDMFGRPIFIEKKLSEESEQFDYVVRMRIDQRVMSYVIIMTGIARFRLTHWLARVYTMSNKIGQVWGFDDSIWHRSAGRVHPTFKCYNDVRDAIFT